MMNNSQYQQLWLIYPCWWYDSAPAVLFRLESAVWCDRDCVCCVRLLQTTPPGCVSKALTLIWSPFSVHYARPLGRPQQIRTISTPLTSSLKLKWHLLHSTCLTHTHWPESKHEHKFGNMCEDACNTHARTHTHAQLPCHTLSISVSLAQWGFVLTATVFSPVWTTLPMHVCVPGCVCVSAPFTQEGVVSDPTTNVRSKNGWSFSWYSFTASLSPHYGLNKIDKGE